MRKHAASTLIPFLFTFPKQALDNIWYEIAPPANAFGNFKKMNGKTYGCVHLHYVVILGFLHINDQIKARPQISHFR